MLALTHHVIVRVAASRVGHKDFVNYALLGDDLVIADAAVAMAYKAIVSDLGMKINNSKSLVSKTGFAEFAKRYFEDGKDLSPLPPKLASTLLSGLRNLPNVLRELVNRKGSSQLEGVLDDKRVKPRIL